MIKRFLGGNMKSKIHIIGAAGSGTTTLGIELANVLPHVHLDTDKYYWLDNKNFTKKREETKG